MTGAVLPVHAVVVPNGPGRLSGLALEATREADLVIAANGGARRLLELGIQPHYLVGDVDSLPEKAASELLTSGCQVRRYPATKDETDTELAIALALEQGARDVDLVGATGGLRLDHSMANVLLLAADWPMGVRLRLLEAAAIALVLHTGQSVHLKGKIGDIVGLLPLVSPTRGITTRGLQYALDGDDLAFGRARGVSNVLTSPVASVSITEGILLVIHQRSA